MLGLGGVGHVCCHSPAAAHSPHDRVAPAAFGIMLAQATSPQLNWWDGLVELWLNSPSWAQAAGIVAGQFLTEGGSIGFRVAARLPEPGTGLLIGCGLAGWGLNALRKGRARTVPRALGTDQPPERPRQ